MNIKISLKNDRGYKWFTNDKIYVKGYLFDERNSLYRNENLLNYFLDVNSEDKFIDKLKANGFLL